jgi:hypothetical protein
LASLLCAHFVQMLCEPLELNAVLCMLAYLAGLGLPIVIKRILTPEIHFDASGLGPNVVPRLPTSRFITTPNERAP